MDDREREPLLKAGNERDDEENGTVTAPIQSVNGDSSLVGFDPAGDPDNPMEWPRSYKTGVVLLLVMIAFTVTFTCIGLVPVASRIILDLEGHTDRSSSILLVTVWELGEAFGPLLIAPLSEIYGRYVAFNIFNTFFIFAVLLAAFSSSAHLFIFARFLNGFAVASNVLNPVIIGDIFPSEQRGLAMSLIMLAPLMGSAIGPAVGGWIAERYGWRVTLYIAAAMSITCEVFFLTFLRETYVVTILKRRAALLRKEKGDENVKCAYDSKEEGEKGGLCWALIRDQIGRPLQLLLGSSVLRIMAFYGGLLFTSFYVMATTFPDMLAQVYGFSPTLTGSSFLFFSAGAMIGVALCGTLLDRWYIHLRNKRGGLGRPEDRLPLMLICAFALPPIIVFYGVIPAAHWSVILLCFTVMLLGLTVVAASVSLSAYIIDAFGVYSASAMTVILIARCLLGTILPLAIPPLTDAIGLGWGFGVCGAICLIMIPLPILVMRYGHVWRQRSIYSRDA